MSLSATSCVPSRGVSSSATSHVPSRSVSSSATSCLPSHVASRVPVPPLMSCLAQSLVAPHPHLLILNFPGEAVPPVDIVMQSPSDIEHQDIDMSPCMDLHSLQGASCPVGGFICSQALGNTLNHADFKYNQSTAAPPNVKGMVHVYKSTESECSNPRTMKSSMTIQIPVNSTLGPVLHKLGNLYSPVKNENHRIYVYTSEETWDIKGRYGAALSDDDMVDWKFNDNGYVLHLFVSFTILIY